MRKAFRDQRQPGIMGRENIVISIVVSPPPESPLWWGTLIHTSLSDFVRVSGLGCSMQDLCCCTQTPAVVCRLSSCNMRAPERGLNSYGVRAQLFHGMWDISSLTRD